LNWKEGIIPQNLIIDARLKELERKVELKDEEIV
jgi:hypothetical protein